MRQILHGWPDDLALAILKNVKCSMKPESRLLIRTKLNLLWKRISLLIPTLYQTTTFFLD
jgi:hypothetical protein